MAALTKARVQKRLRGAFHLHWCRDQDCRRVYTDGCEDPQNNGLCQLCRGRRRPIWETAREPRPCCVGNVELVSRPEEMATYKLAGPGPWFKCKTCGRVQGFVVRPEHVNGTGDGA